MGSRGIGASYHAWLHHVGGVCGKYGRVAGNVSPDRDLWWVGLCVAGGWTVYAGLSGLHLELYLIVLVIEGRCCLCLLLILNAILGSV